MKHDLDVLIVDPMGQPYPGNVTLKSICFMSLQAAGNLPGDEKLTVDEKMGIYKLTNLIVQGGVVEMPPEELKLLKDRLGKALVPNIMGKAFELLDKGTS